jgi:hypothetical protein
MDNKSNKAMLLKEDIPLLGVRNHLQSAEISIMMDSNKNIIDPKFLPFVLD